MLSKYNIGVYEGSKAWLGLTAVSILVGHILLTKTYYFNDEPTMVT